MGGGLTGAIGGRCLGWHLGAVLGYVALSIWTGELASNWSFTVSRDVLWKSLLVGGQEKEDAAMIDGNAWRRGPAAGMES